MRFIDTKVNLILDVSATAEALASRLWALLAFLLYKAQNTNVIVWLKSR